MLSLEQATYAAQYFMGHHRPVIGKYECVFEVRSDEVETHHTAENIYERTPVLRD
jgi:hypothetical protein